MDDTTLHRILVQYGRLATKDPPSMMLSLGASARRIVQLEALSWTDDAASSALDDIVHP